PVLRAMTGSVRRVAGDPFVALLVVLGATTALFIALWVYTLYRVQRETTLLRLAVEAHQADRVKLDEAIRQELDTIYRTLYAPPETEPRQPSTVELWQRNRDKELRDRIARLEQWRLRMER